MFGLLDTVPGPVSMISLGCHGLKLQEDLLVWSTNDDLGANRVRLPCVLIEIS